MKIVRTVAELRATIRELRDACRPQPGAPGAPAEHGAHGAPAGDLPQVGLVPTMGALHEGHLTLIRAAHAENDVVVVSIFVNPKQFDEAADLDAYPRQEADDAALAAGAGADVVFAPSADELYPAGFATTVSVRGTVAETLEGAARGGAHFDGVATVVSKLLIAAMPDRAYFGRKDAQQLAVVERMAADLGLPVTIVGCPTSRDDDGLARSSRNVRLDQAARRKALAIPGALETAARRVAAGERDLAALGAELEAGLVEAGLGVDYVAFVDPKSFEAARTPEGPVLCAIAARVGDVRLIDNQVLNVGD